MKLKLARGVVIVTLTALLPAVGSAIYNQQNQSHPPDKTTDQPKADAAKESKPQQSPVSQPAAPQTGQGSDKQGQDKLIINTDLVNVTVSVTDVYGRFVTGLSKDHFEVYDDKVKQQIAHFTDDDAPVSLGIVYDVSGSMKERIHRSLKALKRFVETSHDDDDFFLLAFNDRANLVQDFTVSADTVLGHLMFVNPRGSTALYDAAYLAVEKIR